MKWKNKQVYYTIKDQFELSERHMAYYYAVAGVCVGLAIGFIV